MEFKTIEEVIEAINTAHIYDLEDMSEELYHALESISFEFVTETSYRDTHRWYDIARDIFTVTLPDGRHFLALYYVDNVFSEMMSLSDTDCEIECVECKPVQSIDYVDVEK